MKYADDKQGSKFFFLAVIIIVPYLAVFGFNLKAAYVYTIKNAMDFFATF